METSSVERLVGWRAGPVTPEVAAQAEGAVFRELLLPHIVTACAKSGGRFTPEGCIERWISGQWTMWAVNDPQNQCAAVGFVAVNDYPDTGLRTLEVTLLGGKDMAAWAHLEPLLVEHARSNGAARIEAFTRGSFEKLLPHWKRSYAIERDV